MNLDEIREAAAETLAALPGARRWYEVVVEPAEESINVSLHGFAPENGLEYKYGFRIDRSLVRGDYDDLVRKHINDCIPRVAQGMENSAARETRR